MALVAEPIALVVVRRFEAARPRMLEQLAIEHYELRALGVRRSDAGIHVEIKGPDRIAADAVSWWPFEQDETAMSIVRNSI